jgi:hypothetical protein
MYFKEAKSNANMVWQGETWVDVYHQSLLETNWWWGHHQNDSNSHGKIHQCLHHHVHWKGPLNNDAYYLEWGLRGDELGAMCLTYIPPSSPNCPTQVSMHQL